MEKKYFYLYILCNYDLYVPLTGKVYKGLQLHIIHTITQNCYKSMTIWMLIFETLMIVSHIKKVNMSHRLNIFIYVDFVCLIQG